MATRAERFKSMEQRSKPKRPSRSAGTPLSRKGGEDETRDTATGPHRNENKGRTAIYALESSATPRPSRKSSRGSHGRSKAATPLTTTQELKRTSPRARHTMMK